MAISTYDPPAGTVLPSGTRSLTVTFTPTDAVNYSGATATVSILVNPLRLDNPAAQSGEVGEDVRLQLEVSSDIEQRDKHGRTATTRRRQSCLKGTFVATGLPAGLRIEDDGEIRGKPTTVGTYHVVVTFTQKKVGDTASTAFDWTVLPRPPKGKKK